MVCITYCYSKSTVNGPFQVELLQIHPRVVSVDFKQPSSLSREMIDLECTDIILLASLQLHSEWTVFIPYDLGEIFKVPFYVCLRGPFHPHRLPAINRNHPKPHRHVFLARPGVILLGGLLSRLERI